MNKLEQLVNKSLDTIHSKEVLGFLKYLITKPKADIYTDNENVCFLKFATDDIIKISIVALKLWINYEIEENKIVGCESIRTITTINLDIDLHFDESNNFVIERNVSVLGALLGYAIIRIKKQKKSIKNV